MASDKPPLPFLTELDAWTALEDKRKALQESGAIHETLISDPQRFESLSYACGPLFCDFSKTWLDRTVVNRMKALAEERGLETWREKLFSGAVVNVTENRAAEHAACRMEAAQAPEWVLQMRQAMKAIVERFGADKDGISDILHIGIGGSELGPKFVCEALNDNGYIKHPGIHFAGNIDPGLLDSLLPRLDPTRTLVLIASKTFTTRETLANARRVREWLEAALGPERAVRHMIGISASDAKMADFGIPPGNRLMFSETVGGRYSVWSAVGLPVALRYGWEVFEDFLAGAAAVDAHFYQCDWHENAPFLHGALQVWHRTGWGYPARAVIPYAECLSTFPEFLQQLEMESSGKRVDMNGRALPFNTGVIVFGRSGTNAQHAFMQMLHQGTETIPADIILTLDPGLMKLESGRALLANGLAQSEALIKGVQLNSATPPTPEKHCPGNRPVVSLILPRLDARSAGALIAFYEHSVFVQNMLWGTNPFDQYGVELGKQLARTAEKALSSCADLDEGTDPLLRYIVSRIALNT